MAHPNIDAQIALFVSLLQALYVADFAKNYPNLTPSLIDSPDGGVKYQRVCVTTDGGKGQRSVYCFIDLSNGDILKAAGWKAPAKGARGNIFNDNCDVGTRADMHGSGLYIR